MFLAHRCFMDTQLEHKQGQSEPWSLTGLLTQAGEVTGPAVGCLSPCSLSRLMSTSPWEASQIGGWGN